MRRGPRGRAALRILPVPIASFLAGAALLGAGIVAAVEIASAVGAVVIGGTFVGLLVRSS